MSDDDLEFARKRFMKFAQTFKRLSKRKKKSFHSIWAWCYQPQWEIRSLPRGTRVCFNKLANTRAKYWMSERFHTWYQFVHLSAIPLETIDFKASNHGFAPYYPLPFHLATRLDEVDEVDSVSFHILIFRGLEFENSTNTSDVKYDYHMVFRLTLPAAEGWRIMSKLYLALIFHFLLILLPTSFDDEDRPYIQNF